MNSINSTQYAKYSITVVYKNDTVKYITYDELCGDIEYSGFPFGKE